MFARCPRRWWVPPRLQHLRAGPVAQQPADPYSDDVTARRARLAVALALPVALALVVPSDASQRPRPRSYASVITQIRQRRVRELKADDGWLTVAGLFWLKPGVNSAGSAPTSDIRLPAKAPLNLGVFELKDGRVTFRAASSAHVTVGGKRLGTGAIEAPMDDAGALASGDLRLFVIRRDDRVAVRMRDLRSATRTGFTALRFYTARRSYRVRARFVPYDHPRQVPVPNVLGQAPEMTSPGYVTFSLRGARLRLEPVYETDENKDLFFIFKDATSGDTTYGAGRFLHAPLPRGGIVTLDFNQAYNPPCAFTDFATCPLPTKQNRLAVRIEAGELAYRIHPE